MKDFGQVGMDLTSNGLALSPDGRYIYTTVVANASIEIEQIAVADGALTFLADGAQPSISPNGRNLAYVSGWGDSDVLDVRDLSTGAITSINLARLLGRGTALLDASITWLGDGSSIVLLPGGVPNDFMSTTTVPALPGSCTAVSISDTCLIVVSFRSDRQLTAERVVLQGLRAPLVMSGDAWSHSLVLASEVGNEAVIYRAELYRNRANFFREAALRATLPLVFDPRGTELLYLVGHNPIALWNAQVGRHRLGRTHELIADSELSNEAW